MALADVCDRKQAVTSVDGLDSRAKGHQPLDCSRRCSPIALIGPMLYCSSRSASLGAAKTSDTKQLVARTG